MKYASIYLFFVAAIICFVLVASAKSQSGMTWIVPAGVEKIIITRNDNGKETTWKMSVKPGQVFSVKAVN